MNSKERASQSKLQHYARRKDMSCINEPQLGAIKIGCVHTKSAVSPPDRHCRAVAQVLIKPRHEAGYLMYYEPQTS
jgi:hypothetical protein